MSPGSTGTGSWASTGPASISRVAMWTVVPVSLHSGGQGVGHRVPAGEGGQQRRMGVEDPTGEGGVDGLAEHRAEAGHDHHVDPVGHQRVGDRLGVGVTVEGRRRTRRTRTGRRAGPGTEAASATLEGRGTAGRRSPAGPGDRRRRWPRGWCRFPRPAHRCSTACGGGSRDAPGLTAARYQRRLRPRSRVQPAPARRTRRRRGARPSPGAPDPFPGNRTGATWPDRPASGIGPTSLGLPCPGNAPRASSIGTDRTFPK